jgi:hypothetical protein
MQSISDLRIQVIEQYNYAQSLPKGTHRHRIAFEYACKLRRFYDLSTQVRHIDAPYMVGNRKHHVR